MALVDYSDSDESDSEQPQPLPQASQSKPTAKTNAPPSSIRFAVDKANPRKIRINLQETEPQQASQRDADGEPAAKRVRTGGGAFSGFSALLPPPKRDAEHTKAPPGRATRKVFSLKTGAEPGFSRESDAELRDLFAEEHSSWKETVQARNIPAETSPASTSKTGNAMMFKPLSVARNPQKKKKAGATTRSAPSEPVASQEQTYTPAPTPPRQKISLFSAGRDADSAVPTLPEPTKEDAEDPDEVDYPAQHDNPSTDMPALNNTQPAQAQSLEAIASDLNLSAAARRQLLGRHGPPSSTAINIVNFNTDAEYAANEILRASGDVVQHNPVRAIASGKHSLKQLVNAATGQKEALEESFATGKRNKKEAGNKYGW